MKMKSRQGMLRLLILFALCAALCTPAEGNETRDMSVEERLALIEAEEAAKREEKEHALKSVVYMKMLGDFGDAFEAAEVYFFCIDGNDYIAASDGNRRFVYLPRVTKSGEYFLADGDAEEGVVDRIDEALDEAHLTSTEEFWNKIALAEKPGEEAEIPRPVDENGVMLVPYYNQGAGCYENGDWTHTEWPSATFWNGRTPGRNSAVRLYGCVNLRT